MHRERFEDILKHLKKLENALKLQRQKVDQDIERETGIFIEEMRGKGFSGDALEEAVKLYRSQLKQNEIHQLDQQLREVDEMEEKIKAELWTNLEKFTRKGLVYLFS